MVKTHSQMVAERRQATIERGRKLLANPNLTPENRERVERAIQGLLILSAPRQASMLPPPALPPLPSEVQTSASEPEHDGRKWVLFAVAGVSVFLILTSPKWQSFDPEAQLGLLIYGPLIPVIFMALAFSSFDLVTRQDLRRDFVAKFVKRPMGTALDLIIFTLMLGFLGLMFLSGISIGPQKSDLYIGTSDQYVRLRRGDSLIALAGKRRATGGRFRGFRAAFSSSRPISGRLVLMPSAFVASGTGCRARTA